jgi:hypothetical protein
MQAFDTMFDTLDELVADTSVAHGRVAAADAAAQTVGSKQSNKSSNS